MSQNNAHHGVRSYNDLRSWLNSNGYKLMGWSDKAQGFGYNAEYDNWSEINQRNYESGRLAYSIMELGSGEHMDLIAETRFLVEGRHGN